MTARASSTVTHLGGTQVDGTDTLRNVERLRFADQVVAVADIPNTPAGGSVTLSTLAPTEGERLTATPAVEDDDGVQEDTLVLSWQVEGRADVWSTVATGEGFTPGDAEVGSRLRVVATFTDGDGVLESVVSEPTAVVANANDEPTGAPVLSDRTPQEGQAVTVSTGSIADRDGLAGVTFLRQWQQSDGDGWADINVATAASFTPGAEQVGRRLRVVVEFTDNNGTDERVVSAASEAVTAAPAPAAPARETAPAPAPAGDSGSDAGAGEGTVAALSLTGASMPRTVSAETVVDDGLAVRFTAPAETKVLEVRVFRLGSRKVLARAYVPVKAGRSRLSLRQRAIVRALRRGGLFRLELTPGESRGKLGKKTVKRIRVRR